MIHDDDGFSLMETIVALVIFAAVFVALERATAIGWRSLLAAENDSAALSLARMKLAEFGSDGQINEEAEAGGDEGGMRWRVTAHKYSPPDQIPMPSNVFPYWVTATVTRQDRPADAARTIEITTLKHGTAQ